MTKVLSIRGDRYDDGSQPANYLFCYGRAVGNRDRLVIRTLSLATGRARPTETIVHHFTCEGVGEALMCYLHMTTEPIQLFARVHEILPGELDARGNINYDYEGGIHV